MPKFKIYIECDGVAINGENDIIEAEDLLEADRRLLEYAKSLLETWVEPVEEGTEDE